MTGLLLADVRDDNSLLWLELVTYIVILTEYLSTNILTKWYNNKKRTNDGLINKSYFIQPLVIKLYRCKKLIFAMHFTELQLSIRSIYLNQPYHKRN